MLCAVCSGVKIDSCGSQKNMTLYAELFNATGKPIVTENCHQGQNFTDGGDPVTGSGIFPGSVSACTCPLKLSPFCVLDRAGPDGAGLVPV